MKSRYAVRPTGLTRRTALAALAAPFGAAAAAWPEFRGRGGSIASGPDLPVEWPDSKNVAWNVALPGYGQSSPVLQGGRLFLTSTSGSHKETLSVLAHDAASGRQLWRRDLDPTQKLENSDTVTKASATAAADGERVYVFFETGELAAFSHEGEVVWQRSLTREYGFFEGNHGVGSSLRLARAGLLALAAHTGPSYLLCVDPATGRNRWKTPRPPQMAWSTPAVTMHLDREIVLVSGGDRLDAYAAEDGSPLWTVDGVKGVTIPSPTPFPGGAVVGSSDKGQSCAIAFPAKEGAQPRILWCAEEAAAYFSSPLVSDGRVYFVNKVGVGFCLDKASGRQLWHARLSGENWISPLAANGLVYFFGADGVTDVLRAGDVFDKVAENRLEVEGRAYGVAASAGAFYLRYGSRLLKIVKA